MGFKKFQILPQNPKLLAFGFTQKRQFVAKIDRNSVFLDRDPYIPDRLYLMDMYIIFYGF